VCRECHGLHGTLGGTHSGRKEFIMQSPGIGRPGVRLLPVLLALCVLLLGCGSGATVPNSSTPASLPTLTTIRSLSTPGTTTYLGTVPGTQAFIGLVQSGQEVRAYVCDGTPTRLATLDDWFTGQVQNGTLAASSQSGVHLRVQVTRAEALGTVTLAYGRGLAFTAPFVSDTSQAGVYEGTALLNGQSAHAGWVVLQSLDQRGAAFFPTGPIKSIRIGSLIAVCATWRSVPSPNVVSDQNFLRAVSAVSASDVWAVGDSLPSSGIQQTLVEHWNGASWTIVPSPDPGLPAALSGVAALSASTVWAVGFSSTSSAISQALIEHWNGATWSAVTSPTVGSLTTLNGVAAPAGSSTVWAVGWTSSQSLTEVTC
jgi:hypothetical protein